MSLFVSMVAACTMSHISAAEATKEIATEASGRYYCDVNKVFQDASACQEVARWQEEKTKELNKLASTEQANLKKLEQEILSGLVPTDSIAEKTAALELEKRSASLKVESKKLALEAELGKKMKTLEKEISTIIETEAKNNNWLEVVNKNEAKPLFASPSLDVTNKIVTAYNNKTRSDAAKAMLRTDSAKAPEFHQA